MNEKLSKEVSDEIDQWAIQIKAKLDNLEMAIGKRFDNLKKVIGDYLELSSSIAIGSVKANLKNI